jgi:N-acetylmuramic acid 6-phosphate etherase
MHSDDLVLGIDGGGSKTVAWLAESALAEQPAIIGRGLGGPANVQAVGFQSASENLNAAIAAAFQDAGIAPGPVAAAVLALAGSDRDENRTVFNRWAEDHRIARRFRLVHDALPVLVAGTPHGWGVALICGTGSLCYGQTQDGRSARAGGWGYLFGDEGSAYAIALAGLRAATHAADGRGPATELLAALLTRLDLRNPEELVSAVYHMAAERAAIAALADVVTTAANQGDTVARQIVAAAAGELAAMVAAVASKLDLATSGFPLAIAGGLLLGGADLQKGLLSWLESLRLNPAPLTPVKQPVTGAVKLALSEASR